MDSHANYLHKALKARVSVTRKFLKQFKRKVLLWYFDGPVTRISYRNKGVKKAMNSCCQIINTDPH